MSQRTKNLTTHAVHYMGGSMVIELRANYLSRKPQRYIPRMVMVALDNKPRHIVSPFQLLGHPVQLTEYFTESCKANKPAVGSTCIEALQRISHAAKLIIGEVLAIVCKTGSFVASPQDCLPKLPLLRLNTLFPTHRLDGQGQLSVACALHCTYRLRSTKDIRYARPVE
jgi:hypothetical protein